MRDALRAGLAVLILSFPGGISAKVRLMRVLDWRTGLPVSYVGGIEQDPEGFLWVVTSGGVFRYDGAEMVSRIPADTGLVPGSVTAGWPLTFRDRDRGWEVRQLDGTPISGPDGRPLLTPIAHVTPDGALWAVELGSVQRRSREGAWGPRIPLPDPHRLYAGVSSGRNGSILVPCRQAVLRVDPAGRLTHVAHVQGPLQILDRADGSTVIGSFVRGAGYVYEVRDGAIREIDRYPTRFMALAERHGVLWIAYDSALVRLAPGEPRDTITTADGLPSGGAMLVDREGSLWVGTFRGLVQFPEPDSVSWQTEVEALGRHLLLDRGSVWMSTWSGLFRARLTPDGWTLGREPHGHIATPCLDRSGTLWTVTPGGFAAIPREGAARSIAAQDLLDAEECAVSSDGALWFPTTVGLYLLDPGAEAPRLVLPAEGETEPFRHIYEDSRGTLWAAREAAICRTSGNDLRRGGRAAWTCDPAPHRDPITLLEMESGDLWAGTFNAGVWRFRGGRWEEIPASRDLASRWASGLFPSPRGGVWIAGEGNFLRVRERPDLPGGWEVLERIGLWQGLPTAGVMDVAEAEDGTLWAATNLSLVQIPSRAREARPQPPPVVLVEAAVDGRPLEVEEGRAIELPYRRNRLELRFAALSYRDPSLIRYRSRLNPDEAWSAPTRQPFFRFVDLPPRRYHVAVEASLDGDRWSAARPEVVFQVLRPWYGTWWFRALVVAFLASVLVLAYRLRVASILKLERQRMRIAMDLHDEVGSGLGSIGVLAGLLSRDLPEPQRADLSGRISGVARELSQSLGDIVWSLRTGSGDLDSLWVKILDRGRPLFAGGSPTLRVHAPDPVPAAPLSLIVRRNVSLMVIEALHNAARHAAAAFVTLTLGAEGDAWVVSVEDDGRGLRDVPADATRHGLGLEAMRLRAAEMGGSVIWQTPEGGGTRVVIRFRAGRD